MEGISNISSNQLSKEIMRAIKIVKKLHGQVSISWIQYKFKLSFKEAEKILGEFNGHTSGNR